MEEQQKIEAEIAIETNSEEKKIISPSPRRKKEKYSEKIKKNKLKIKKLEMLILKSNEKIEKIKKENLEIMQEILEKSGTDEKILEIILKSKNNMEAIEKTKELIG